jgi:hypothetical protein
VVESDGGGNTDNNTLSNLVINSEIVGKSASFPDGDGSGAVNFTISATNATSYKILIGSETLTTTTGKVSYTSVLQAQTHIPSMYLHIEEISLFLQILQLPFTKLLHNFGQTNLIQMDYQILITGVMTRE